MRTVKFRVWNPDDLKMEFPLVFSICMSGKLQPLIKCSDGNRAYKDYPINQFTGLIDKNGVEIYEGDIVKVDIFTKNYCIVFGESKKWGASFQYKSDYSIYCLTENFAKDCVVVGNIYENPELL